jgi:hypothetical protein
MPWAFLVMPPARFPLLNAAQDLLEVMDDRFGQTSTIIVAQVPLTDWHIRIPNPIYAGANPDLLEHNALRIIWKEIRITNYMLRVAILDPKLPSRRRR